MIRPPTRSKLMYTLVPDTTLLRSVGSVDDQLIPRLVEVATETAAGVDTGGEVFEGEDGEQGHAEGESDKVVWKTAACGGGFTVAVRSEEHTYELQSLMRNSYAVFRLKQKQTQHSIHTS